MTSDSLSQKQCILCGLFKYIEEFIQRSRDGSEKLRGRCTTCLRLITRNKRARDPEKTKADRHAYYLANKAYILDQSKKWAIRNPEGRKAIERRQYWKNKERYNAKTRKRRHRRRANGGEFTQKEWVQLCEKFGNVCLDCGESKPLTVDHIIPVSKNGTSDIGNIQPLCLSCNSAKRDKIIDFRLSWKIRDGQQAQMLDAGVGEL